MSERLDIHPSGIFHQIGHGGNRLSNNHQAATRIFPGVEPLNNFSNRFSPLQGIPLMVITSHLKTQLLPIFQRNGNLNLSNFEPSRMFIIPKLPKSWDCNTYVLL